MLPNVVAGALLDQSERIVNARCGVSLHTGQDVAVKVKRDPDARMTEPLTGDLRMDAARKHVCSVRVPKIVKPDPGEGRARDQPGPLAR